MSGISKSMLKFTHNCGGCGRLGSLGSSMLSGLNEKRGSRIFICKLKLDKSTYILGIFTLGIGMIGISKALHKKLSLQVYWSYVS
jgi:hypothetical protein